MTAPVQERDRVGGRSAVVIFVVTFLLIVASLAATAGFLVYRPHAAAQVAPPEKPTDAEELRREQEKKLHGYGYTDRDKTVAHIPIERAIEIVSQESP
jgi:hypothetical protein